MNNPTTPSMDYYEILEISKDADLTTIKSAYRRLAMKYHPDKNLDNVEEAEIKVLYYYKLNMLMLMLLFIACTYLV